MIEREVDGMLLIRPGEDEEWFALAADRDSMIDIILSLFRGQWTEEQILAKLARTPDHEVQRIAVEHAIIEHNRRRWGYDVRFVRPN